MGKEELLRRADDHIFSLGLDDSGAQLGLANMRYGLAKIHWVQERIGLPPNGTFIAAPDLSVTRNRNRWQSGFGYGGKLTWGDGDQEFVVLDVKPNCCGMLVGGLDMLPGSDSVLRKAQALKKESIAIEGVPIVWDFGNSNHFMSVFRVKPLLGERLPPYVFIIHCSGGELRGPTALGEGLYWDESEALRRKAQVFETPLGQLRVLVGSDASAYYSFFQRAEAFARKRRSLAAEWLFGDYLPINNDSHQGLLNMNEAVLGVYPVQTADTMFPLALRAELPAYLVRGKPSLSPLTIQALGFGEQARQRGVYERLRTVNVVPHGGGYTFPHLKGVARVIDVDGVRYFEVSFHGGQGRQLLSEVGNLPYAYRGHEVVDRVVELGMAELMARLDVVYTLKV